MGTNSHAPERPLEYRVRWGNVLLAATALCGVVAALLVPTTRTAAPVAASAPRESAPTGATSLVAEVESSAKPRRGSPPPRRDRRRKRTVRAKTKQSAPAERLSRPPIVPAPPHRAAPSDPVASEFGL